MVTEREQLTAVFEYVRSLFDVLRGVMKGRQRAVTEEASLQNNDDASSLSSNRMTESERKTVKNIELVIDIYKRAADRIGRVGEREWREVIEQ